MGDMGITDSSYGYFWWQDTTNNYGLCFVVRGAIHFFLVDAVPSIMKIEDCENMLFIACPVPEQIKVN